MRVGTVALALLEWAPAGGLLLNLLKHEHSLKLGLGAKRLATGWDEPYPLDVLRSSCI